MLIKPHPDHTDDDGARAVVTASSTGTWYLTATVPDGDDIVIEFTGPEMYAFAMAAIREVNAPPVRLADVAAAMGVKSKTVRRWIDQGRLEAVTTLGGHKRVTAESFAKALAEHGVDRG